MANPIDEIGAVEPVNSCDREIASVTIGPDSTTESDCENAAESI
jgi:hypothetical protein